MLLGSPKDVVSGKSLVFGNSGVNWAQKWTKTVNFGYVPFWLKDIILKDCSEAVFVLLETTSGKSFSKIGLRNLPKVAVNSRLM